MTKNAVAKRDEVGEFGPAMKALPSDRWRSFVLAMFLVKPGHGALTAAARMAGVGNADGSSSNDTITRIAQRIAHDPRTQEAIQEEAKKRIRAASPEGLSALLNLVGNPFHKDHAKAIGMLLDRTMPVETLHKVEVTRKDETITPEVLARIDAFAERYKLNLPPLPAPSPDAIEVEYEEVDNAPSTAGLEDVLGLSDEIENDEESEP